MKPDSWLKELYEANYNNLYRLACNRLRLYAGHTSDVQDILQDVFLEAAKQNICSHPKPEAWLVVTTINICKNPCTSILSLQLHQGHKSYVTEIYKDNAAI